MVFFFPIQFTGENAPQICAPSAAEIDMLQILVVTAQKNSIQCVDKMCEDARYRNPLQIFHAYKSAWKCECSLRASLFM